MIYCRIIQGTTPFLKFPISTEQGAIKGLRASFVQGNDLVFVKNTKDCRFIKQDGDFVIVPLTQQDTYLLDERKGAIEVTIRAAYKNGAVLADIYQIAIKNTEDKEVIK